MRRLDSNRKIDETGAWNTLSIRRALIAALVFFGLTASARADDGTYIPEFYLLTKSTPHCVFHIDFAQDNDVARNNSLLEFVKWAYEFTLKWKTHFAIVSVDYAHFRYAHVISYSSCAARETSQIESALQSRFGRAIAMFPVADDRLVGIGTDLTKIGSPARLFSAFHSPWTIAQCAMSIPVASGQEADEVVVSLGDIWKRYRFSIADIRGSFYEVDVIFSRQCSDKPRLFDSIRRIANKEHSFVGFAALKPNFNPDVRGYIESYGHPPPAKH